ncbi:hypothetical protein DERP_004090 [Dermatophagoides pteronyssinus]|uniref:Uncharacterized protein n=1 Tax=Dermatophagoides pteronyssinus TaxID=6956 RepID=A0ABQ8J870_DERPT|nr:hypothetical protein DERP_004090 [Dermatophagoides pteronyssinus]
MKDIIEWNQTKYLQSRKFCQFSSLVDFVTEKHLRTSNLSPFGCNSDFGPIIDNIIGNNINELMVTIKIDAPSTMKKYL